MPKLIPLKDDGLIKKQAKKKKSISPVNNLDDDFDSFINDGAQNSKQTTIQVDTPNHNKARPILPQHDPITPPVVRKNKVTLNVLQKTEAS
jgi:hypothetical protein